MPNPLQSHHDHSIGPGQSTVYSICHVHRKTNFRVNSYWDNKETLILIPLWRADYAPTPHIDTTAKWPGTLKKKGWGGGGIYYYYDYNYDYDDDYYYYYYYYY